MYFPAPWERSRFVGNGAMPVRGWSFPLIWSLLWPLRLYIKCFPLSVGKGFITRRLITPALPPPPASFVISLPGAASLTLQYRELLGVTVLLQGAFEAAELDHLRAQVKSGTTFVDVGANVGLYTVAMAPWVGPGGRVMAFEPLRDNTARLRANVAMNHFNNVDVYSQALGDTEGTIALKLSNDPCYPSVIEVMGNRGIQRSETVPITRLDTVWTASGCPEISAIKIDVEGAELMVLKGAQEVLTTCKPYLQLEASTDAHLQVLSDWLTRRGYVYRHPAGFMAWNHAFVCRDAAAEW
jgi:FkbM family methyltransferase